MLPADMGCTKEAKDVIIDCCVGKSESPLRELRVTRLQDSEDEELMCRMGKITINRIKQRLRRFRQKDNITRTRHTSSQGPSHLALMLGTWAGG
jgi:hypothetical protein